MLIWIPSLPDCAFVNTLMQDLTGARYQMSEQHKELGKSRHQRDLKDLELVLSLLNEHSPFSGKKFEIKNNIMSTL